MGAYPIPPGFHQTSTVKWACNLCGAKGFPVSPDYARGWVSSHMRKHYPCPTCGKVLVSHRNGEPRKHLRCPNKSGG